MRHAFRVGDFGLRIAAMQEKQRGGSCNDFSQTMACSTLDEMLISLRVLQCSSLLYHIDASMEVELLGKVWARRLVFPKTY